MVIVTLRYDEEKRRPVIKVNGRSAGTAMRPHQDLPAAAPRLALDNLEDGVLMVDDRGLIRYANPAFAALFSTDIRGTEGKERRDITAQQARVFQDPAAFESWLAETYDRPYDVAEIALRRSDKGGITHVRSRPVRGEGGRIEGRIEVYRTAEDEECSGGRAEKAIAIESLPVAALVIDGDLGLVTFNAGGRWLIDQYLGYVPEELTSFEALGHDHPLTKLAMGALADNRREVALGLTFKESQDRFFDAIATPFELSEGRRAVALALWDVTDRQVATARAEAAWKQAEFFVDLMGHDISNFNQITMGYLEMLGLTSALSEDERSYLEKAMRGVEGSNRLIENVRLYRSVKDKGDRNVGPCDLAVLLKEDIAHVVKAHGNQSVVVNERLEPGLKVGANSFVHHAFRHLLDNAIKYDRHPEKVIDVDVIEPSGDGEYVTVRIVDRGPGISPDRRRAVFERIGVTTRGAGIGLSIVNLIVTSLGGRIWIEDRIPGDQGQGSVFVVQLKKA